MNKLRFRNVYMVLGSFLVLCVWVLSDPDAGLIRDLPFGASTVATVIILLKSVLYVGMLHISRKALIDYVDLKPYFDKALQTSEGAGRALIAVSLIMIAIALTMYTAVTN